MCISIGKADKLNAGEASRCSSTATSCKHAGDIVPAERCAGASATRRAQSAASARSARSAPDDACSRSRLPAARDAWAGPCSEAYSRLRTCACMRRSEQPDSPFLGKDAGELVGSPCGVQITDRVEQALPAPRADRFHPPGRHPGASAGVPRAWHVNMVIGTTGFRPAQKARSRGRARDSDHDGAEHERGRER